MLKSEFHIPLMDCPSEENLIRVQLSAIESIHALEFDLQNRSLAVFHTGDPSVIEAAIHALGLQGKLVQSAVTDAPLESDSANQRNLLWAVLAINLAFFVVEVTTGLISRSMGLVADSLDMLADAFVYGISILAIGRSTNYKKNVATVAGYFQLVLASVGFLEIVRRFFLGIDLPDHRLMITISILALIANGICLFLLNRSQSKEEAHMKASMIFTSNDVIINLGVITAGFLVLWTQSVLPDLIVGSIVFILVLRGARRILVLGK